MCAGTSKHDATHRRVRTSASIRRRAHLVRHGSTRCIAPGWSAAIRYWRRRCRRPWRMPLPARRAGWNVMSYRIGTCISFPWLARPETTQPRKKRGKKTQGVFFRDRTLGEVQIEVSAQAPSRGRVVQAKRQASSTMRRDRHAATAATGRRSLPAGKPAPVSQPGRERPPSVARRVVRAAAPRVAHAPAAGARVAGHVQHVFDAHGRVHVRDMWPAYRPARRAHGTEQPRRQSHARFSVRSQRCQ